MARLALALVLALGVAQDPSPPQVPTFRSEAALVSINVSVTDQQQRFVAGLTRSDFAIYEDGVPQEIRFFEASETPLDLILLIDTSSSMADKMSTVHRAAGGFLKTLRSIDRGAVVAFSDRVQILQALTDDQKQLDEAVAQTRAGGGTALHDALYVALRQFGASGTTPADLRRRTIALLSDGQDTSSLLSFDDVMGLARKSGVSIYTIGLQSRPENASGGRVFQTPSQYALRSLASETGGEAFFPTAATELESIYGSIARELANQYLLAYVPSNSKRDGRFRQIEVRIPSRADLRARARRGYTVSDDAGPRG